ncbi:polysaccharide biosynthesis C-terminal domain-containing protein [Halarchaeum sp. CBA1220]|uniref:oligosaccharide flippase family protein n=1 Tax=Halarchaeum sp. CBA1220 TaxID=1853682 RepID=UPI0011CDEC18|nr:polysaccharide biosynthesis C-terminal domain-containing protein [Halarchaeum sp. CBA1220]QLC34408.1 polysaccharide biosynthesis C-terminal domain-containing protein [Halarchaeum sp. CBA1220]
MAGLARASAVQFSVTLARTVVGALVTIYAVRILGAGAFGQYALALGVVGIVRIPTSSVSLATSKRISEGARRNVFHTTGLLLLAVVVTVAAAVILLASAPLSSYIGFAEISLVAALYVSKSVFSHATGVLRGEHRVEAAALADAAGGIGIAALQFVLLYTGGGVLSLLRGEIVAAGVTALVCLYVSDRSFAVPDWASVRSLYEYGRYVWLGEFRGMSYSWVDTVLLGFFVAPAVVGAYEVAWRITALFMLLPQAFGAVTFPSISEATAKGRFDDVNRILNRMLPLAPALAIPGAVGALVIGTGVLSIYGASVVAVSIAPLVLVLLSLMRCVESFETSFVSVLDATDHPEQSFRVSVVFILSNIALNLALIPTVGAVGAALATLTALSLSAALAYRGFPAEVDVSLDSRTLGGEVVAAALMGGLLAGLTAYYPANGLVIVLLYVGLGAAVYGAALTALSPNVRARARQLLHETGLAGT